MFTSRCAFQCFDLTRASVCIRYISHDISCLQRQEELVKCFAQSMNSGIVKNCSEVDHAVMCKLRSHSLIRKNRSAGVSVKLRFYCGKSVIRPGDIG
jgi:hypothetical protein